MQSGTERYRAVQSGTERYRAVQSGINQWYRVVQSDTGRYRVVQSGKERYRVVQSGAEWYRVAQKSQTGRYRAVQNGTEWYRAGLSIWGREDQFQSGRPRLTRVVLSVSFVSVVRLSFTLALAAPSALCCLFAPCERFRGIQLTWRW